MRQCRSGTYESGPEAKEEGSKSVNGVVPSAAVLGVAAASAPCGSGAASAAVVKRVQATRRRR